MISIVYVSGMFCLFYGTKLVIQSKSLDYIAKMSEVLQ